MNNNYIKLNNNDNHLSLGNLFNIIKKIPKTNHQPSKLNFFALFSTSITFLKLQSTTIVLAFEVSILHINKYISTTKRNI